MSVQSALHITGGTPLKGTTQVNTAKNSVLFLMLGGAADQGQGRPERRTSAQ